MTWRNLSTATGHERRENHSDKRADRRYSPVTRNARFIACLALSACASPAVDTAAPNFSETQYATDLDKYRGGTALEAAARGFGVAVLGSFVGAAQGADNGAIHGGSKEGAIIGTIVGSVIGFAVGSYTPIERQNDEVGRCLTG